MVADSTRLTVRRAPLFWKFYDSKPTHIPWHVIRLYKISSLRSASHGRKCCSNCFPHRKKKPMEITKPQLSCGQSSLEWALTRRGCHETKANFPFPSLPHADHIPFFKMMAAIQRAFNLCKSTAAPRWNWHSKGPQKPDLDVLIEILSPDGCGECKVPHMQPGLHLLTVQTRCRVRQISRCRLRLFKMTV